MAKFYMAPCVASAIQKNSRACQSFDEKVSDVQDIIVTLSEKRQTLYRPCFQMFQEDDIGHCFQILGLVMAADQGGNSSLRAAKVIKEIVAEGWPDIHGYIARGRGTIPFDAFWLNRAVDHGVVKTERHPFRQIPDNRPVLSRKERRLSHLMDRVLGTVPGTPQIREDKLSIFSKFASDPGKGSAISSDEFCIFLYTASLYKKKIQDDTSLFKTLFFSCMQRQQKLMAEVHQVNSIEGASMIQ